MNECAVGLLYLGSVLLNPTSCKLEMLCTEHERLFSIFSVPRTMQHDCLVAFTLYQVVLETTLCSRVPHASCMQVLHTTLMSGTRAPVGFGIRGCPLTDTKRWHDTDSYLLRFFHKRIRAEFWDRNSSTERSTCSLQKRSLSLPCPFSALCWRSLVLNLLAKEGYLVCRSNRQQIAIWHIM